MNLLWCGGRPASPAYHRTINYTVSSEVRYYTCYGCVAGIFLPAPRVVKRVLSSEVTTSALVPPAIRLAATALTIGVANEVPAQRAQPLVFGSVITLFDPLSKCGSS